MKKIKKTRAPYYFLINGISEPIENWNDVCTTKTLLQYLMQSMFVFNKIEQLDVLIYPRLKTVLMLYSI